MRASAAKPVTTYAHQGIRAGFAPVQSSTRMHKRNDRHAVVDAGDATATATWAPSDAGADTQMPFGNYVAEARKRRLAPSDAGAPSASTATASSRTEQQGDAKAEEMKEEMEKEMEEMEEDVEDDDGCLSLDAFLPDRVNA